jgi:hypothetical protein
MSTIFANILAKRHFFVSVKNYKYCTTILPPNYTLYTSKNKGLAKKLQSLD